MKRELSDNSCDVQPTTEQQDREFIIRVYIAAICFVFGLVVAGLMHEDSHGSDDSYHQHLSFAPVPLPDVVPVGRSSLAPGHLIAEGQGGDSFRMYAHAGRVTAIAPGHSYSAGGAL